MKELIILILLTGCGYAPMDATKPIIITEVAKSMTDKGCVYYGYGNLNGVLTFTSKYFMFRDSCGKFNIGDTVYFIKK